MRSLGCFFIKNFLQNWYILNQYGTGLSISRHATIEVALPGWNVLRITALLNPQSSEFQSCVGVFFVVYLSHGICSSGIIFVFLSISLGEVETSSSEEPQKKVAHLYRSMPPCWVGLTLRKNGWHRFAAHSSALYMMQVRSLLCCMTAQMYQLVLSLVDCTAVFAGV